MLLSLNIYRGPVLRPLRDQRCCRWVILPKCQIWQLFVKWSEHSTPFVKDNQRHIYAHRLIQYINTIQCNPYNTTTNNNTDNLKHSEIVNLLHQGRSFRKILTISAIQQWKKFRQGSGSAPKSSHTSHPSNNFIKVL